MKSGIELIAAERQKQIDKHGFTGEHHAQHPEWYENNQLQQAAMVLLMPEFDEEIKEYAGKGEGAPDGWDAEWFGRLVKRSKEERFAIVGALLAAELDRISYIKNGDQKGIKEPVTIIDTKEFLQIRSKAEKWDNLGEKIDKCYGDYDENNEEMKSEYEEEHGSEADLSTIGEIAASAYGYL